MDVTQEELHSEKKFLKRTEGKRENVAEKNLFILKGEKSF